MFLSFLIILGGIVAVFFIMGLGLLDGKKKKRIPSPETVVVTEKGSTYTYCEGGTTQRYKTATGELNKPCNLLVYIPPFEVANKNLHPSNKICLGESKPWYEQTLLGYVHKKGNIIIPLGKDKRGVNCLKSNSEAASVEEVYLGIGTKDERDAVIPVSITPKKGWSTFDVIVEDNGYRSPHIGHKVVKIIEPGAKKKDTREKKEK